MVPNTSEVAVLDPSDDDPSDAGPSGADPSEGDPSDAAEPVDVPGWSAAGDSLQDAAAFSAELERLTSLIASIEEAARGLHEFDLGMLGAPRTLDLSRELARVSALVDSTRTRAIARVEMISAYTRDGLRSTKAELVQHSQMSGATAAREVKRVRGLRQLPLVAAAFANGELSADQVDSFIRVLNDRTAEAFADDEERLVGLASRLTSDQLARELRIWAEHVDTDGPEPDPGHADRGFVLSQGFDGRWHGSFTLGSGDGALVAAAVGARADQLFREDQRSGVERSATQRRADALRDLLLGDDAPVVTLDLVINADDIEAGVHSSRLASNTCTATVGGGFVSAADTLRLAADAAVRAVVIDPSGGAVLYYGRRRRLASRTQRASLAIETGGVCGFAGCDRPIDVAHHIVEWENGNGLTDTPSMVGLCHDHHDEIHEGGWTVDKAPEGTLRWQRPDGSPLRSTPGWRSPPDDPDDPDESSEARDSVVADVLRARQRLRAITRIA